MSRRWSIAASLAVFMAVNAGRASPVSLPQDAYIWQQRWTPAVTGAIAESASVINEWHVLAFERARTGNARRIEIDAGALSATGRPVVPVFRWEGRLSVADQPALTQAIRDIVQAWTAAGLTIGEIEIDYDSPVSGLRDYASLLNDLRRDLGLPVAIWITALPAWMDSGDLEPVLDACDGAVLQVHSVANPRHRLFDRDQASRWVDEFDRRDPKPFRISLPAYGSRVMFDAAGQVAAVESEAPIRPGNTPSEELIAPPAEIAAFLADLGGRTVPRLGGIVWFRLPTSQDRRAWSPATWRAVMRGDPAESRIRVRAVGSSSQGVVDLLLVNDSEIDGVLPAALRLPDNCVAADAINGYVLSRYPGGIYEFNRVTEGLLHGGARRVIGWARCGDGMGEEEIALSP
jgi:hypothetical protein